MTPLEQWEALAGDWRLVAEAYGFRLLDRRIDGEDCFDYLRDAQGTFLDLHGLLGETQGFWSATLTTWLDFDDGRVRFWNVGEKDPPPMPRDPVGGFVARLALVVLRGSVAKKMRAGMMTGPRDLVGVIQRHRTRIEESGGKPVFFEGLAERFEQARKDDAATP